MKKSTLELFIKKFNLEGIIPKVKLKYTASAKTLHARAVADNRSFMVDVILNDFDGFGADDSIICIGDVDKMKGMLRPFGEDITLSINKSGDRILGFTINDADCEVYCSAADSIAIEAVPKNLSDIPDADVIVPLTDELIEKFVKSKMALKEVDLFAVGMNKKNVFEIVFGYLTSNANKIRLTPVTDPIKNKLSMAMQFPVINVSEALKSNADMENGLLSIISSQNMLQLSFSNPMFTCNYFQFSNTNSK
jgi:hypothetical protein